MCAGVLAFATIVALAWSPGDAANPDSATYVDGARHLARGEGFVTCRTAIDSNAPGPILAWPPGFSALMVPGIWLGLTPLESARVVLGLSFVAAALLVFALARAVSGPRLFGPALLAVPVFALQPSQLYVLDRVLSDVPFVPAVLLCVYLALLRSRARRPKLWLEPTLGAALAAMVYVRNAGLLAAAGIFVGLFVSVRARSWVGRLRALVPTTATFVLLVAPWMIRNKLLARTPFGRFGLRLSDPTEHVALASSGVTAWITDATKPFEDVFPLVALFVAVVAVFGLALLVLAVKNGWWKARAVRLIGSVIVVYAALMVVTATLHPFNPLHGSRFWVPTWPLTAIFALALLRSAQRRSRLVSRAAYAAMAVTALLYAADFVDGLPSARRAGGLLDPELKAVARIVPPPQRCRLLISDARPVMLRRELGLASSLPETREEFETVLENHSRVCVAVLTRDLPAASRRRPAVPLRALSLVRSLERSKRLRLVAKHPEVRVYEAVK